ncbi:hypothetical protein OQA88_5544 [Cercophora sp. LCS_1]
MGGSLGAVVLIALGVVLFLVRRLRRAQGEADKRPLLETTTGSPVPVPVGGGWRGASPAFGATPGPGSGGASPGFARDGSPGLGLGLGLGVVRGGTPDGLKVKEQGVRLDYLYRASELDGGVVTPMASPGRENLNNKGRNILDETFKQKFHVRARREEQYIAGCWSFHYIVEVTSTITGGRRRHNVYKPRTVNGQPKFQQTPFAFYTQDQCIKRGIRWADINDDGMDDMLCIAPDGSVFATINNGIIDEDAGNLTTTYAGLWKSIEGYPQARVRIADIDGDGRADYCVVKDNADIACWRNGGTNIMPDFFQPLGTVFTGKGLGDVNGVRFFDINGDGRDDWLWMDNTGRTHTYTNSRSCVKGVEGQGLVPNWRAASSNPTHPGRGDPTARGRISFARIFDSSASFGLRGRGDYVEVVPWGARDGGYLYSFDVIRNTGAGGAKLKGDGTRFCNMMGHTNGAMDLLWIHSTGHIRIYQSKGGGFGAAPYWGPNYIIWDQTATKNMDRRDIHLADWNGDGQCDIIYVDPGSTGRISVWLNRYKENGNNFNGWTYIENAGPTGSQVGPRCAVLESLWWPCMDPTVSLEIQCLTKLAS